MVRPRAWRAEDGAHYTAHDGPASTCHAQCSAARPRAAMVRPGAWRAGDGAHYTRCHYFPVTAAISRLVTVLRTGMVLSPGLGESVVRKARATSRSGSATVMTVSMPA